LASRICTVSSLEETNVILKIKIDFGMFGGTQLELILPPELKLDFVAFAF